MRLKNKQEMAQPAVMIDVPPMPPSLRTVFFGIDWYDIYRYLQILYMKVNLFRLFLFTIFTITLR